MTVFEMSKKYYDNGLWSLDRLKMLVEADKLSADEYKKITGEDHS